MRRGVVHLQATRSHVGRSITTLSLVVCSGRGRPCGGTARVLIKGTSHVARATEYMHAVAGVWRPCDLIVAIDEANEHANEGRGCAVVPGFGLAAQIVRVARETLPPQLCRCSAPDWVPVRPGGLEALCRLCGAI